MFVLCSLALEGNDDLLSGISLSPLPLSPEQIIQTISQGLGDRFQGQRVLILIPDHTRSLPLPSLFRSLVQWLQPVKQLGFMVALVTHLGLTAESLNLLVGITSEERSTIFREIGLFNHECNNPAALVLLGVMAHSTHLRGSGVMDNGIEKPNVRVTLASKISRADCERLNLGYLDPSKIDLNEWKDIEDARTVYVPRAGEVLYRLKP